MSYWPSAYFKREEFACKCGCGFDTVDFALVSALEKIRLRYGQPITITSGCRCEAHNKAVGGSQNSQHLKGRAADIVVKNVHPDDVAETADILEVGGIGTYPTFTHIDTRNNRARW